MAATPAVIVLWSFLLLSLSCHAEDTSAILLEVVNAVEKLLKFYKASHQHLNLDGYFGLKIVEGQIQGLLDEHKQGRHPSLSPDLIIRLSAVVKDAQSVAEQAIATVHISGGQYFQDMAFIAAQPWRVFKKHRKITPSFRWEIPVFRSGSNSKLTGAESDKCLMELGPSRNATSTNGSAISRSQCRISEQCAQTMTKRGLTEYGITHQILWTALAEQMGCVGELDRQLSRLRIRSSEQMQEEWCSNVYFEMLAVVHVYMSGTIKSSYQDMFLEQQFICASLGFYEFLKKKYLDQILSWQLPSGCFGGDLEAKERSHSQDNQNIQKGPPSIFLSNKEQGIIEKSKGIPADFKANPVKSRGMPVESGGMLAESRGMSVESKGMPVESKGMPVESKGMPAVVKSLDLRQQQLSQQLKDLQFHRESDKLMQYKQGSNRGDVDTFQQQLWVMNARKVAYNENRLRLERNSSAVNQGKVQQPPIDMVMMDNQENQYSERERRAVLKNERRVQHQPSMNAQQAVIALPEIQTKLTLHPAGIADYNRPTVALMGRRRDSPNQNMPLANANLAKQPQFQYSNNQNHIKLPVHSDSDSVHPMNLHSPEEQKLKIQLVQNSDNLRKPVTLVRLQGRSRDVFSQNVDPGLPPKSRKSNHRAAEPYLTRHRNTRKLLVERQMPGHCLSHKTGMATGALVMYLRYLINPGPLDLSAPHDFFPDSSRDMGSNKVNRDIASFLSEQRRNGAIGGGAAGGQVHLEQAGFNPQGKRMDNAVEEEEEEEEDDNGEDGEYDDNEELYPDGREEAGQQRERRVVHFGANNNPHHRHQDDDYGGNNKEDDKDEYVDENEDKEKEEGDYINRVKANNDLASLVEKDTVDDDTEYTYYDDEDDTNRGIIIKRHKPQVPPQKGARIRTHNRHKPHPPIIDEVPMGLSDAPPTKTVVVLLSATSLLLIVFMYRFIRKRRIHVRHTNRGFFKL